MDVAIATGVPRHVTRFAPHLVDLAVLWRLQWWAEGILFYTARCLSSPLPVVLTSPGLVSSQSVAIFAAVGGDGVEMQGLGE